MTIAYRFANFLLIVATKKNNNIGLVGSNGYIILTPTFVAIAQKRVGIIKKISYANFKTDDTKIALFKVPAFALLESSDVVKEFINKIVQKHFIENSSVLNIEDMFEIYFKDYQRPEIKFEQIAIL